MKYDKQFKTYDELADMLFEHGMTGDRGEVMEGLQDVGYYRLSGYWYIFKEPDGMFAEGTDFKGCKRLKRQRGLPRAIAAPAPTRPRLDSKFDCVNGRALVSSHARLAF